MCPAMGRGNPSFRHRLIALSVHSYTEHSSSIALSLGYIVLFSNYFLLGSERPEESILSTRAYRFVLESISNRAHITRIVGACNSSLEIAWV